MAESVLKSMKMPLFQDRGFITQKELVECQMACFWRINYYGTSMALHLYEEVVYTGQWNSMHPIILLKKDNNAVNFKYVCNLGKYIFIR